MEQKVKNSLRARWQRTAHDWQHRPMWHLLKGIEWEENMKRTTETKHEGNNTADRPQRRHVHTGSDVVGGCSAAGL